MARERTNLREVLQQELDPAPQQPELAMRPEAKKALYEALKSFKKSLGTGGESHK
jgi:hypothetical protein